MSLFNWFFGKSAHSKVTPDKNRESMVWDRHGRSHLRDKPASLPPARVAVDPANRNEERKVKRHARREQLYLAVREAFTHAGVLSATYKFKVLSLDQVGNEFLVMMDVDHVFDHRAEKLADIETKVTQIAKTRYEIRVTSVYWRISTSVATRNTKAAFQDVVQAAAAHNPETVNVASRKTPHFRYDPIQDDEVAAFKRALETATANSLASVVTAGKVRTGPRSYTLLTGFEDTEMPESASTPVLSTTQYGDLN